MRERIVITDSNVVRLIDTGIYGDKTIVIPAGEEHKNLKTLSHIWEEMERLGATRETVVVNVGGGMVSDIGGFAAATFKRGLRYENVATTLLAAVDASIGGKTAINFHGLKNEIGAFHKPEKVSVNFDSFHTLPEMEKLSGYGEMLKTALLEGEKRFNDFTRHDFLDIDSPRFREGVEACMEFKRGVTDRDPHERGERKKLNLGHTFGHALETLMLKKGTPVAHGIAVAHGLLAAVVMSRLIFGEGKEIMYRLAEVIREQFNPHVRLRLGCEDVETLMEIMGHDKKNEKRGHPRMVLLRKPGDAVWDVEPTKEEVGSALEIYQTLLGG